MSMEWLKNMSITIANLAIVLSVGFGFGFYVGHPGPLVYGSMEHSNVTLPGSTSDSYPCVHDGSNSEHISCVFRGENSTWLCSVTQSYGYPSTRNETCATTG